MVRKKSERDKGEDRHQPGLHQSLAAIESGWRDASEKSWRLQKRPVKTGFNHCGLEKTELGIERNFMGKLEARWKKSLTIWSGEVSGGLGTGQFLEGENGEGEDQEHCGSAEDFRKGQHKSRGHKEHKDQALMREREFSGQW